jgi:hypothetical protein
MPVFVGDTARGGDGRTEGNGVNYWGMGFRREENWLPDCNPLPNTRMEKRGDSDFSTVLTIRGNFGFASTSSLRPISSVRLLASTRDSCRKSLGTTGAWAAYEYLAEPRVARAIFDIQIAFGAVFDKNE